MESSSHKLYHVHGFHSRTLLDVYFSREAEKVVDHEAFTYPMEKFHNAFCTGDIKGDLLIDISMGPVIHHLFSALKYFRDIIILKPTDHCIIEVNKWMNSRTGAFNWSHTAARATEMAGKSDQSEDMEIRLKAAITHVVRFDLNQENLTDPIRLPQADCLVLWSSMDVISKDLEDFVKNLRKFSKLLKLGGYLMYYGVLNATFFMVGEERFHVLKYNESNLRSILSNEGFVITNLEVSQRKAESDQFDFDSVVFCTAYRNKKL